MHPHIPTRQHTTAFPIGSFYPTTHPTVLLDNNYHTFVSYSNVLILQSKIYRPGDSTAMTTSFSSLPIVDVGALKAPDVTLEDTNALSKQLYDVFSTTGFAYLVNVPLSFGHDEIFGLARDFFALPADRKMRLAKKSVRPEHHNTYRGYADSSRFMFATLTSIDTFLPRVIWQKII